MRRGFWQSAGVMGAGSWGLEGVELGGVVEGEGQDDEAVERGSCKRVASPSPRREGEGEGMTGADGVGGGCYGA